MATSCAQKKLWLAEAELAFHNLMTGQQAVTINFGPSKSTSYTQANKRDLESYINRLRDEVAACCGETPARKKRGTVRVIY